MAWYEPFCADLRQRRSCSERRWRLATMAQTGQQRQLAERRARMSGRRHCRYRWAHTALRLEDNNLSREMPAHNRTCKATGALPAWKPTAGKLPAIGDIRTLTVLNLADNRLKGAIPPALGKLTRLEGLNLSSNELTAEIPAALGNLSGLVRLDLSENSYERGATAGAWQPHQPEGTASQ